MRPSELSPSDLRMAEAGSQFKDFLQTAAGQWLMSRLVEGGSQIATEALFSPAEGSTPDYYKGRAKELAAVKADIDRLVQEAESLLEDGDPFDDYDGPQLGSGSPAAVGQRGDFGA
jgi:hypothetical protein